LLPGLPLQSGEHLKAAPEVLLYLAKSHHDLWLYAREMSWSLDSAFHQPARLEHKPRPDLKTSTKNKDVLNINPASFIFDKK